MKVGLFAAAAVLSVGLSAAATIPRPAPEFTIHLPNKQQLLLSQHRGKVVLLEFIFTTCSHCQHASQLISKLQTEYGPKGFQALAVAFNDMSHLFVDDFKRDFRVNYPVGFSAREPIIDFLQVSPNLGLHVPQVVFIDRKGIIRHQSLAQNDSVTHTEASMRKWIEQLLAEPAGISKKTNGAKPAGKTS